MSAGETETRWFSTRSPVRENQNRDRPVRTRPLSGISVGRTTSKALRRSDATRRRRSAETAYRSRTLPERRNVSASGIELDLQAVETGDHGRDMAKECAVVEAAVQVGEADPLGDVGVGPEEITKRETLVGGAQRGALHDRIGRFAAQPTPLDEEPEHPAARVEAETAGDVLAHPLLANDESLDQAGHLHEHVVEEDRRVGQDHPLGARVADVALVPQRLVLHRGERVAAEQAG